MLSLVINNHMCSRGVEESCMEYVGEMGSIPVNLNDDVQIKMSSNRRVNAKEPEEEDELIQVAKVVKSHDFSHDFSKKDSFREMDDMYLQKKTKIWLSEVLRVTFKDEALVADLLADGELLFNLYKVMKKKIMKLPAGSLNPKVTLYERTSSGRNNERYLAYPKIDSFLKICKLIGLKSIDLFSPSDVVEKRNTRGVCLCLRTLSKKAILKDLDVPDFDTVTYAVPMPKGMVNFICRNLKQPQIRRQNFDPVGLLDRYLQEMKRTQSREIDSTSSSGSSDGTGSSLSLPRTGSAESGFLLENLDGNGNRYGRKLKKCPSFESLFCPSSRSVSNSIYHLRPKTSPSVCQDCLQMQSSHSVGNLLWSSDPQQGSGGNPRRYSCSAATLNREIAVDELRRKIELERKTATPPAMGNNLEDKPTSTSPSSPCTSNNSEDRESRFSKTADDFDDINLLFDASHWLENPATIFESSSTLDSSYRNFDSAMENAAESPEADFAHKNVERCEKGDELEAEAPIMAEEKTGDPQEKQPNHNIFLKAIANGVLLAGGLFFALQFGGGKCLKCCNQTPTRKEKKQGVCSDKIRDWFTF